MSIVPITLCACPVDLTIGTLWTDIPFRNVYLLVVAFPVHLSVPTLADIPLGEI